VVVIVVAIWEAANKLLTLIKTKNKLRKEEERKYGKKL